MGDAHDVLIHTGWCVAFARPLARAQHDFATAMAESVAAEEEAVAMQVESVCGLTHPMLCEMKAYKMPPPDVISVAHPLCLLFGATRIPEERYARWQLMRRIISSTGSFMERLISFDGQEVDARVIEQVRGLVEAEDFPTLQAMRGCSEAAAHLGEWLRAVIRLDAIKRGRPLAALGAVPAGGLTAAERRKRLGVFREEWMRDNNGAECVRANDG